MVTEKGPVSKIKTYDRRGQEETGWLLPIWNSTDGPRVDQVYLTVISQGQMKGPHLHMVRRGLFKCIRGSVQLVTRAGRGYRMMNLGIDTEPVVVLPGTAAALYNRGVGDAYVLNMPSPAWDKNNPDEHEVAGWNPRLPE